jgi:signal transduction histidine kinase
MTPRPSRDTALLPKRRFSRLPSTPSLVAIVGVLTGVTVLAVRGARRMSAPRRGRSSPPLTRDLLTVLAHELRTPLNSIVGWVNVLQTGNADAALTATALRSIASSAQTQRRLIEDIVDTMRADRNAMPLRREVLDLRTVVRTAVDVVRPAAESANLRLSVTLPSTSCDVWADGERLQQAFGNVLTNAVKFTPSGGIDVAVVRRPHEYEVHVADTGHGIDRNFLPFVFTRFEQAEQSGRRHGGLGLGLAICRDLIEQHNGRISVDSRGAGHGATVVMRLPALTESDDGE